LPKKNGRKEKARQQQNDTNLPGGINREQEKKASNNHSVGLEKELLKVKNKRGKLEIGMMDRCLFL